MSLERVTYVPEDSVGCGTTFCSAAGQAFLVDSDKRLPPWGLVGITKPISDSVVSKGEGMHVLSKAPVPLLSIAQSLCES